MVGEGERQVLSPFHRKKKKRETYLVQRLRSNLHRVLPLDKSGIVVVRRVHEQPVPVVEADRVPPVAGLERRRHDVGVERRRAAERQRLRQVEVAPVEDPHEQARLELAVRGRGGGGGGDVEGEGVVGGGRGVGAGEAELLDGGARVAGAEELAGDGVVVARELQGEGVGGVVRLGGGEGGEEG